MSLTSGGTSQWQQGEGNHIYYNPEEPLFVSIGTTAKKGTLAVLNQGDVSGSSFGSTISNVSSNSSADVGDNRVGLHIESSGEWGGESSAVIGLHVDTVNGHQFANQNLAAVLNGNTVIGNVFPEDGLNSVGVNGQNVFVIQESSEPSSVPGMPGVQMYTRMLDGKLYLGIMDGNGDVITLRRQAAITTRNEDGFSADYDATVITVLDNMRKRINELEDIIIALGLLP